MTAMNLTAIVSFDNPFDSTGFTVTLILADENFKYLSTESMSPQWKYSCSLGSSDPGNFVFPTVEDAAEYLATAYGSNIMDWFNTYYSSGYDSVGEIYYHVGQHAIDYIDEAKNRANHTGTQDVGTITGLSNVATSGSYDDLSNKPSLPSVTRTTSSLSLSLVGSGATGTQISSTKDSTVRVNCSVSTTSTIGGPATSIVTLKKCATNDSTEGNWTSVAVLENDQTVTLAIILNSVQVVKSQLVADIPAGWYVKLVASGTGTHSEAFISGEKTIYG